MEEDIKKTLGEIKSKVTKLDQIEEDVHLIKTFQGENQRLIPRFVENSPTVRTYSDMIEQVIGPDRGERLRTELYIIGHINHVLLDKLLPVATHVKIISPLKTLETKKNKDALAKMSKAGAEVRIHDTVHARIFCAPPHVVIIGSGDLQNDCFGGTRYDAGIYSNYPDVIKSAVHFFNRVWEESHPLPEKSAW